MSMLHEGRRASGATATAEPQEHRAAGPDERPDERPTPSPDNGASAAPEAGVAVHRRRSALALVGTGALAVAVAYVWRAAGGGSPFGYLLAAAMLPICVIHFAAWWDARVPLLVADPTGLRLRQGREWTGLRWEDAPVLRLTPTRLPRRDGRLVVENGDGGTRTLPLALVDPADLRALPDELRQLAGSRAEVLVDTRDGASDPPPARTEPDEALSEASAEIPAETPAETSAVTPAEPAQAEKNSALRRVAGVLPHMRRAAGGGQASAVRADVLSEPKAGGGMSAQPSPNAGPAPTETPDTAPDTAPATAPDATTDTASDAALDPAPAPAPDPASDAVSAAAPDAASDTAADSEGAEAVPIPPADPVVGPRLTRAREWVRLSVDDVSERTRIRPHVIEAIEADDFSACGGDVYARGHLRALARALGIDADPLIADYDACYASAPVSARRVFEAELAGPGRALRPTSGGPRWSVLIAVVLVLVLMWALARLLVPPPADNGNGNGGADAGQRSVESSQSQSETGDGAVLGADAAAQRFAGMGQREPVSTRLQISVADTTTEAVPVVVRAADGSIAFRGTVSPDQPRTVRVAGGEATVRTPDAAAVQAEVDGRDVAVLDVPGAEVQTSLSP